MSWTNHCPGDLSFAFPPTTETPTDLALDGAQRAAPGWASTPVAKRIECLRAAQRLLKDAADSLAQGIACEVGKPLTEAREEAAALVRKIDLTLGEAEFVLADREYGDNPHPNRIVQKSRGPAAVIAPFNFPLQLAHGPAVAHLLAGNPVLFKPSPLASNVAARYAELMTQALPPEVFTLVQGGAEEAVTLARDTVVRSVVFTGSVSAGRDLATRLAGDYSKDLALELGGKNAAIVLEDADLESAARAVAEGMCLTAGQRCNSTSRLLLQDAAADKFLPLLADAVAAYQPGDPREASTNLGPLISSNAVARYARAMGEVGCHWLVPGEVYGEVRGKKGFYVKPAVLLWEEPVAGLSSWMNWEELFAPVLSVQLFEKDADCLSMHDASTFGLVTSVFTKSRERFERLGAQLRVGNVYANLPTTFSPVTLPFGGWLESGNGRPSGRGFLRFTTDEQVIQTRDGSLS
jgi:acyl-CoA reductase-like NAD-dependent aldehyde dehydrogenase